MTNNLEKRLHPLTSFSTRYSLTPEERITNLEAQAKAREEWFKERFGK